MTEPPDIRDQDLETNSQAELDSLQPEHVTNDGEINSWVEMEQPNFTLARVAETELEKMRLDMELTMLKCQYEEKEKQRQHKEKMEQMRLQASSGHVSTGESVNRGRHDPDVCSPHGPSLKYFQISTKIHFFEKTSIQSESNPRMNS